MIRSRRRSTTLFSPSGGLGHGTEIRPLSGWFPSVEAGTSTRQTVTRLCWVLARSASVRTSARFQKRRADEWAISAARQYQYPTQIWSYSLTGNRRWTDRATGSRRLERMKAAIAFEWVAVKISASLPNTLFLFTPLRLPSSSRALEALANLAHYSTLCRWPSLRLSLLLLALLFRAALLLCLDRR